MSILEVIIFLGPMDYLGGRRIKIPRSIFVIWHLRVKRKSLKEYAQYWRGIRERNWRVEAGYSVGSREEKLSTFVALHTRQFVTGIAVWFLRVYVVICLTTLLIVMVKIIERYTPLKLGALL